MEAREANNLVSLNLKIGAASIDQERLAECALALKGEIRELKGVKSLVSAKKPVSPKGAKAGELVDVGNFIVNILPIALPSLIAVIGDWVNRANNRVVIIEYENNSHRMKLEVPTAISLKRLKSIVETVKTSLC